MAVPGERCRKCDYCGKELGDDLKIFCILPYRDPSENVCWCVCEACKVRFLKEPLSLNKGSRGI